jgi:hypothetical protein
MNRLEAIDEIISLLDAPESPTTNTSMRIPDSLRRAAALAVGALDMASSTTALATDALRTEIEHIVFRAALEAHYDTYPEIRPSLAELAVALAEMDGSDLADDPEAIARAAEAVTAWKPDADPDDVLVWAAATREAAKS